ncbi:MAG TPA: NAD(P)-dependent methylenetetrahydromethanopterin dehydrogenase, partial [Dongiaceae bacterium]
MDYRHILHMLSPLGHVSPFDVNMAVDAGFDVVVPYTRVELREVGPLIQDAIFSRGPKGVKATGAFIGGKNAELALDMLDCARKAMVPPFEISVFADPAGSFTTAAAMVAKVEKALAQKQGDLAGRKVVIFGGTGVVGFASAVITALQKASPVLVGYDGVERVKQLAESAKKRFGVEIGYADGSSEAANGRTLADAEIVLSAPKAGIRVVSKAQLAKASKLLVAADVNAVPPSSIEGVEVQDDGKPIPGTQALGIGALAIGNVKYKVQAGLLKRMTETPKPIYLDFRDAFDLARQIVG